MGLFSSKKKTYTTTTHSRLLEDSDIKNDAEVARLSYALNSDSRVDGLADSFADVYRTQLSKSVYISCIGANKWAKSKYYFGVPKADQFIQQDVDMVTEMRNFLLNTFGLNAEMVYAKFGPINQNHATYHILADNYGYDLGTNELTKETSINGSTTYLLTFTINYCKATVDNVINPDYLNPLGYSPESGATKTRLLNRKAPHPAWQTDVNAKHDYVVATFIYWDKNNNPIQYTKTLDFLKYENSGDTELGVIGDGTTTTTITKDLGVEYDYYMLCYLANNKTYVFTYKYLSGGYPKLDSLFTSDVDLGTYPPNLMFRLNSTKLNSKDESYDSCKVLARRLGLDYENLNTSIHDNISGINDVSDIFLSFRLPMNTKDKMIIDYMYEFFMEAYKSMGDEVATSDSVSLNRELVSGYGKQGLSIQIRDNAVFYSLAFKSIWYTDTIGTIGDVGYVDSSFETSITSVASKAKFLTAVRSSVPIHTYRKQITSKVYRTIKVYGASSTQSIGGSYTSTASGDEENLMVPIDLETVQKKYPKYKTELISKSMYLVINTIKVVKTKWYATGPFKIVMFIAAVVLAYFTGGSSLAWYLAVAKAILVSVLVSLAVTLVTKLLVNVFGIDPTIVAAIVAVVAMALGGYALSTGTNVLGHSATAYMSVMSGAFNMANQAIALTTANKVKAFKEYEADVKSKMSDIDELKKDLGLDVYKIDKYDLLASPLNSVEVRIGETPRSFYERTLSTQNGLIPILLTHAYVYMNTQLPTFQDTMNKWRYQDGSI